MMHSKMMDLLYDLLPFHAWKAVLLGGHIENCPACSQRLASREEARRLLVQAGDVGDLDGLWPAVSERMDKARPALTPDAGVARISEVSRKSKFLNAGWRWAAAGAGFLAAAFMVVWLVQYFGPPAVRGGSGMAAGELEQVQIHYVRIDNEPAQTFIFKPHDSNVVIVWAGKNL